MSVVRVRSVLIAGSVSLVAGLVVDGSSYATTPEPTAVEVLPPDEPYAGATRGEWDARYWQWSASMPVDINPTLDPTGERCGYGQSGPVFFLPAGPGGASGDYTCVVPEGMAIYASAGGAECSTVEPPPFFGRTEEELRACAAAATDETEELHATINGQELPDMASYRTSSPLFTLTLPENNLFGVEPGIAHAVSENFSVIIAPPPPGEYVIAGTLKLAGDPQTFSASWTLIVQPAQVIEPPPTTEAQATTEPPSTA